MKRAPTSVAEAYLATLKTRGVDWIFGNAGTDFAPLVEAYANADDGLPVPHAVEILHETVAVAMAHGYYLMTGKPQCAMVHVNVGTANGLMGIMNASRSQTPVLFAAGRTPITEQGRVGSRNAPIHWGQEMFDQGGMLREFVKWDNELRAPEQVVDCVDRALAVAQAEPKGPVYLSLPREVLAERLPPDFAFTQSTSQAVPSVPYPDPAAITAAAELISNAKSPVLVASNGGAELFEVLGDFVLDAAIPVAQFWRISTAISTDHQMFAGDLPGPLLADADLVIVLDTMVPWLPGQMPMNPDCKILHIGADPLFSALPTRSFKADLSVTSSPTVAVKALHTELRARGHDTAATTVDRRGQLSAALPAQRQRVLEMGAQNSGDLISPPFLSRTLSEVVGTDATFVNELGVPPMQLDLTHGKSFYGTSNSAGLGWGGGAALGIKLAEPERLVVWTTGDGSYVFSNPAACHHAAASLNLNLLTIVTDNRVWNAVRRATIAVYPQGTAAREPKMALTSLEPAPDYTKFVEAYGGWGAAVSDPNELKSTLEAALEQVRDGRQALVAVHCSYPDQ